MSTQKGNSHRTRAQKHKNGHAFKNSMHDTTNLTQMLNSLDIHGVCNRCKEQIEWRIRYKKYKPLAAPKKCVKCEQKTVKRAYTAACEPCGAALKVCAKCLQPNELIEKSTLTQEEENHRRQELEAELRVLPERKRRTVERKLNAGKLSDLTDEATPSDDASHTATADNDDLENSDGEVDLTNVEEFSDGDLTGGT